MNRYGQSITWGPLPAPALFTGERMSYSYRDAVTKQNIDGAAADFIAMALHSRKAELNFEAKVTDGSTDFLDLSQGSAIAVSGISAGVVLARQCVEKWLLQQPKTCSVQATHFPDMVQANPVLAGVDLDAFTPAQSGLGIVYPGAKIIYGTFGLGHASGIIHGLTLTQILQITEDDPSPDGKLLGAASHGYERTISLDLLATGALPAVRSVLTLTGAPGHAADYRITSSEKKFGEKRGMMYGVEASWIPPFTA